MTINDEIVDKQQEQWMAALQNYEYTADYLKKIWIDRGLFKKNLDRPRTIQTVQIGKIGLHFENVDRFQFADYLNSPEKWTISPIDIASRDYCMNVP